MARRVATWIPAALAALLAASGCGSAHEGPANPRASCEAAWNAAANESNRELVVSSGGAAWNVEVSRWTGISGATPGSGLTAEDLIEEGCGYMFFTAERWMSMGGVWDDTGSLRWQPEIERGARAPEQRQFMPTATVTADGLIR